jgi:hypothetical protein
MYKLVIKKDGVKRVIFSSSLDSLLKIRQYYKKSIHFQDAYISRVFSNEPKPPYLGELAVKKVKKNGRA